MGTRLPFWPCYARGPTIGRVEKGTYAASAAKAAENVAKLIFDSESNEHTLEITVYDMKKRISSSFAHYRDADPSA